MFKDSCSIVIKIFQSNSRLGQKKINKRRRRNSRKWESRSRGNTCHSSARLPEGVSLGRGYTGGARGAFQAEGVPGGGRTSPREPSVRVGAARSAPRAPAWPRPGPSFCPTRSERETRGPAWCLRPGSGPADTGRSPGRARGRSADIGQLPLVG